MKRKDKQRLQETKKLQELKRSITIKIQRGIIQKEILRMPLRAPVKLEVQSEKILKVQ